MRYHLWTVLSSRAGPYGVLDSGAVTGAPGLPYWTNAFRGLLRGVFPGASSPPFTVRGLSGQEMRLLLVLFYAVSM